MPLTSRRRTLLLATLWLVMLIISSQFLIMAPVLPRIGEALSIPEELFGTLVSGYAISLALFALIAGPISDRFGRRAILRIGTLWIAAGLLLHLVAWDYTSLLVLRIVTGAGSGFMSGAVVAYLGDAMPYEERGRALGWVLSGMPAGMVLGVPLGTVLAGWWGFHAPFVLFGSMMAAAFLGTLAVLVPTGAKRSEKLSLGLALRSYGEMLGRRDLLAVVIATVALNINMSAYVVYLPTWLEGDLSATPHQIAILFLVAGVANVITVPASGALSDRIGRRWLVVGCSVAMAVAIWFTAQAPTVFWATVLYCVGWSLGGARFSPLQAWITALVEDQRRGTLMSLCLAANQVGFAIGAGVAGWAFVEHGYWSNVLIGALASIVTALLLATLVPEPRRESTDEHGRTRTNTDGHGRARTGTDGHGPARTSTDQHGRTRTSTDEHGRTRTNTELHGQRRRR